VVEHAIHGELRDGAIVIALTVTSGRTSAREVALAGLAPGAHEVLYRDADGTLTPLGTIRVPP
jgi:hypothetical protein